MLAAEETSISPSHTQSHSGLITFIMEENISQKSPAELSFCLVGQKKWVKSHSRFNHYQRVIQLPLPVQTYPDSSPGARGWGAGSPSLSPWLFPTCVYSNIVGRRVQGGDTGVGTGLWWHPAWPSHLYLGS